MLSRITPAHAGKRIGCKEIFLLTADHPRVCGEKGRGNGVNLWAGGSPPRVRGKPRCAPAFRTSSGITPACAGKTANKTLGAALYRDHPRVCGENQGVRLPSAHRQGSPPRVRGKPRIRHWERHCIGITPACAGKTAYDPQRRSRRADHPRVCGENRVVLREQHERLGSPPRVRGKHDLPVYILDAGRITPACAGKTKVCAIV